MAAEYLIDTSAAYTLYACSITSDDDEDLQMIVREYAPIMEE